jgi:hypothetical protein
MFSIFVPGDETKKLQKRLLSMTLKPLYRSENRILVGLMKDFQELCVLDGLVIEIDLGNGTSVSPPAGGISILKKGSYIPIRQHEKSEYSKIISRKLKKRTLRKIIADLESPPSESIETLVWVPERLSTSST